MESTNKNRKFEVSEIQLSYKPKVKPSQRPKITSSNAAYELLISCWDDSKIDFVEQFKVVLLNRANKVLGIFEASTGGVSGTVADPKVIFVAALKANASSIIVAHNHPSGSLSPSQHDVTLTQRLKEVGKFLDLPVLDHLVISSEGYFSFADEGLM
jgi:DNA repair protein RadC